MMSKSRNIAVATLLVAGALIVATADLGPHGITLTVDGGAEAVYAGTMVTGIASDDPINLVSVRMYIDGELVAEDESMNGPVNAFDFMIPPDAEGKQVTIEAVNDAGEIVRKTYTVRPPRG